MTNSPPPRLVPDRPSDALLPCPWCGGTISTSVSEGSTFRWRKVDGCCADGPEVRHDTMADDQEAAEIDSHRRAVEAWNTRAAAPAAPAPDTAERNAYDVGWIEAAVWAGRDDLISDMDSPSYKEARELHLKALRTQR